VGSPSARGTTRKLIGALTSTAVMSVTTDVPDEDERRPGTLRALCGDSRPRPPPARPPNTGAVRTLTVRPEQGNCANVERHYENVGYSYPTTVDVEELIARYSVFSAGISRGFCSFSLAALPAGATILSADLRVLQTQATSSHPTGPEPVIIDALDYGALEDDDFDRAALMSDIGRLPPNAPILQSLSVNNAVAADFAASRTRSQFRLRSTYEGEVLGQGRSGESPTARRPPSPRRLAVDLGVPVDPAAHRDQVPNDDLLLEFRPQRVRYSSPSSLTLRRAASRTGCSAGSASCHSRSRRWYDRAAASPPPL
jgi:hypothetical protein